MAERARLGWVIVYVPAVEDAIAFYERAFGLERTFIDPSGTFGQLATGDTALAFAHESLAVGNFPGGVRAGDLAGQPSNVELALVFDDPLAAFEAAVGAGCTALAPPEEKPHGQVVGWVRDPWGTLIEVCSPVG
ncbi:MAG TPA: VOC family protein [Miltoncostaea sp.]|nr:VOC family protein [Miltoncostaea sp.]